MRIIGAILVMISAVIINRAVGTNVQLLFGEAILITGIWCYSWKTFLKEYGVDIDGKEKEN